MVLVYLLIKLGDLSWANVGKYSSTMEHMGYIKKYISFYPRNAYIYVGGMVSQHVATLQLIQIIRFALTAVCLVNPHVSG
jgi:hypothetical protein